MPPSPGTGSSLGEVGGEGAIVPYCPGYTCHLPQLGETLTEGGGSYKRVYLRGLWSLVRLYPWLPGCLWGPWVDTEPLSSHSRHSALVSQEELFLLAQDRQRMKPPAQGPATLVKNCFLPLREYFKYFSTELTSSL